MSCPRCEARPVDAWYRWRTTNVRIRACREHWQQIAEVLNQAQEIDRGVAALQEAEPEEPT